MVDITLNEEIINAIFLLVLKFKNLGIFGCNILFDTEARINMERKFAQFKIHNKQLDFIFENK